MLVALMVPDGALVGVTGCLFQLHDGSGTAVTGGDSARLRFKVSGADSASVCVKEG
jgi:hypothetical protein